MKKILFLAMMFCSFSAFAQHSSITHGSVYGTRPDEGGIVMANDLEHSMGTRPSIVTSIRGKVLKVTKEKGGWFTIDAGNGKTIAAHFKDYRVNIPASLAGRTVMAAGVATKQFVANRNQHMAGATQTNSKDNPKQNLKLEVSGLVVE